MEGWMDRCFQRSTQLLQDVCRQAVVITHVQFLDSDGVVFVDGRQRTGIYERCERIFGIHKSRAATQIVFECAVFLK